MFSDNHKISIRQTFRLFTFDLVGISSLIVPPYLAVTAGRDGIFSILIGTGLGVCYLLFLCWIKKEIGCDLGEFMKRSLSGGLRNLFLIILGAHCVFVAGFGTYLFTTLIQYGLIREEHPLLIAVVILAVAAYAVSGGIESRARAYEVLFWFVFLPLCVMLIIGAGEINPQRWTPLCTSSFSDILKGGYIVFVFYTIAFWMLFFPKYLSKKNQGKPLSRAVAWAMGVTFLLLLSVHQITLGRFGAGALAKMQFPVITLMNDIQFEGSFIRRLDAIMLSVWFFTLLAFLNLHLYYAKTMCMELVETKGNLRDLFVVLGLVFLVTLGFLYRTQAVLQIFLQYVVGVGTPLLVLLPPVIYWIGKGKNT